MAQRRVPLRRRCCFIFTHLFAHSQGSEVCHFWPSMQSSCPDWKTCACHILFCTQSIHRASSLSTSSHFHGKVGIRNLGCDSFSQTLSNPFLPQNLYNWVACMVLLCECLGLNLIQTWSKHLVQTWSKLGLNLVQPWSKLGLNLIQLALNLVQT